MGKIVVHTLAFNLSDEVFDAVKSLYELNSRVDFKHIIVDLGFPLFKAEQIPSDIQWAKQQNTNELIATAEHFGSMYAKIENVGVSQNWTAVYKLAKARWGDIDCLICADPDERPENEGWVQALADVLRTPGMGWASLMMHEQQPLINDDSVHYLKVNNIPTYVPKIPFCWAQGGFSGRFIEEAGGIPFPSRAPIYGWIESAAVEKMVALKYKWVMLQDYYVKHTMCSQLYQDWKVYNTESILTRDQISFEQYLILRRDGKI